VLGADIDASGANFNPIGVDFGIFGYAGFEGIFDGLGHTVSNLTINASTDNVGLFGVNNGTIRNVGIDSGTVSGRTNVGALAGINNGQITNSYAFSSVAGNNNLGGLVGRNNNKINNSFATGNITSNSGAGSFLFGSNTSNAGGLVGLNTGNITDTYATGNISLVRHNYETNNIGGLVGRNEGVINTSYASGKINATNGPTGLFGSTPDRRNNFGGLVGSRSSSAQVNNSYWNTTTSGSTTSAGGSGVTDASFKNSTSFGGFDTTNSWYIQEDKTAPLLRAFLKPLTVSADDTTKVYDGQAFSVDVKYSISGADIGPVTVGGNAQGAKNAGSYSIDLDNDYTSNQFGYIVTIKDGSLTITPRKIEISTAPVSKVYGEITTNNEPVFNPIFEAFNAHTQRGLVAGDEVDFLGKYTRTGDLNVGTKVVDGVFTNGNYDITVKDGTLTITKATLNVAANYNESVYGTPTAYTANVTGFKYDDATTLNYNPTFRRSSSEGLDAGLYLISFDRQQNLANYNINYTNNIALVKQATLTVKVDDVSNTYGSGLPQFTVSFDGFKYDDNESNVTASYYNSLRDFSLRQTSLVSLEANKFKYDTDAGAQPNAGDYDVALATRLASRNYKFEYEAGTFSVDPLAISITANNANKAFGAVDPTLTFTNSQLAYGQSVNQFGVLLNRAPGEIAGNYLISGSFLSNPNYIISFVEGNFTIESAAQSQNDAVTNAQNAPRSTGTPNNSAINYVDLNNAPPAAGEGDEEDNIDNGVNIFFVGNGVSGETN